MHVEGSIENGTLALKSGDLDLGLTVGQRLDLLRSTLCKDLTTPEFELFIEVARARGLSPLTGEIYAIKRKDGDEKKVSYQTGIDGFRLIAQRTGHYEGQVGPFWCGKDGVWVDIWLHDEPPFAAKVGILRA